jgi:hypothetical protein
VQLKISLPLKIGGRWMKSIFMVTLTFLCLMAGGTARAQNHGDK